MALILVLKPLEEMGNLKKIKKSALWSRPQQTQGATGQKKGGRAGGEQQAAEDAIY